MLVFRGQGGNSRTQALLSAYRTPEWSMLIENSNLMGSHAQNQSICSCPAAWPPRFSLGTPEKTRVLWSQLASNWKDSTLASNFLQQLFKTSGCVPQQVSANWSKCWLLETLKRLSKSIELTTVPHPDLTPEISLMPNEFLPSLSL